MLDRYEEDLNSAWLIFAFHLMYQNYFTDAMLIHDSLAHKDPNKPGLRRLRDELINRTAPEKKP